MIHYYSTEGESDWHVNKEGGLSVDEVQLALLHAIRNELRKLNRVFACSNFLQIPSTLRDIKRNTKAHKAKPHSKRRLTSSQRTT